MGSEGDGEPRPAPTGPRRANGPVDPAAGGSADPRRPIRARPAPEATNTARPAPEATNAARPAPEATNRTRPVPRVSPRDRARAAAPTPRPDANGWPEEAPPLRPAQPRPAQTTPRVEPSRAGQRPSPAEADPTPPRGQPAAHPGLRYRVLPRTLLGIASLMLAFAVGAGFSGVVLYSYFQYHLDQTNGRVNNLIDGYTKQFKNAEGDLQASANRARVQIQNQLAPLQQLEADPKALAKLVRTLSPSLFFVHTQDVNGQPAVGSAFVVASNADRSLLLTSATTVAASQHSPAPTVYVRQGNNDTQVSVRTVDTSNDLALIVLPRGRLPVVRVAPSDSPPRLGDKVYAMSGQGTAGASVSQGAVTNVSSNGIADNAPIGPAYQGGPLVNANGQIVAIASFTYAPEGFMSTGVYEAPYPQAACSKVLSCPDGSIAASQ